MGWADRQEGGWLVYPESADANQIHEFSLCWMFFDVHFHMPGCVRPRDSAKRNHLQYTLHFVPVSASQANPIIDKATELNWRDLKEYQLPIFTRNNDFKELISKNSQYMWWASSYDCYRDDTTGFDDNFSACIDQTEDKPAAWYARCWGWPYESEKANGKYKISAKVKTQNCTGSVRIAVAQTQGDNWINSSKFDRSAGEWSYSREISGTNDWTEISVVADMHSFMKHIVLEQVGPGKSWFDNVIIEKIVTAE